ncbi:hypothetical protein BH20ACT4_BH20ACT4_06310 [soil metagenome]
MSVTEYERHQLFNWFEEHMGPERAETMMKLVPPVGWGDVATREDLLRFQAATREDLVRFQTATHADIERFQAATHADIERFQAATGEQIQQLESATDEKLQLLRHELAELEVRLDAKLEAKLEAKLGRLERTFATWLFTSQAAVIGAVAVLLAID